MQNTVSQVPRWLAVGMLAALGMAVAAEPVTEPPVGQPQEVITPEWQATQYLGLGKWNELEALMLKLTASGERSQDGRYRLFMATTAISDWLERWDEDHDSIFDGKFAEYEREVPGSAFAPIVKAMQLNMAAWRARGSGYMSTVTPEGRKHFERRNRKAWAALQEAKERSSRIPTWYEQAIHVGMDVGIPDAQITALLDEGIRRFPGFHSIYFAYMRQFAPQWGGDYDSARRFIEARVSAKTNPEGEVLYARLYWVLDQYSGSDVDFFEESLVSWPRMRKGFELMMKGFPDSKWNRSNFAAFACRVGDGSTYFKWRMGLRAGEFNLAAPQGLSMEVCDARFSREA